MSATDAHDFEIVGIPEDVVDESLLGDEKTTPTDQRSVRDLFDAPNETSLIQTLAKIIVLASLPMAIGWTTLFALVSTAYLSQPDDNILAQQYLLPNVSQYVQHTMDWYRDRLIWTDNELPQFLERQAMALAHHKSVAAEKLSHEFGRRRGYCIGGSSGPHAPRLTRRTTARKILIALSLIAAHCLVPFTCPVFMWGSSVPIWVWIGIGYWYSQRRQRTRNGSPRFPTT